MRRHILFAVALCAAAAVSIVGPSADAQDLPSLPGMGAAERVMGRDVKGEGTSEAEAVDKASAGQSAQTPATAEAADVAASTELQSQAKPVLSLPGAGALPVIGNVEVGVASASGRAGAGLLVPLAALGSLAAIAGLVALRRADIL